MEPCISTSRDGAGSLSRPCGVYPQSLTARHRPHQRSMRPANAVDRAGSRAWQHTQRLLYKYRDSEYSRSIETMYYYSNTVVLFEWY